MAEARFELFVDGAGQHRWRLRGGNGEIVATSEGYTRRSDAKRGAEDAWNAAREAAVEVEVVD